MSKLYFTLAFTLLAAFGTINGQENLTGSLPADSVAPVKTNPILFADLYFGGAGGSSHGFSAAGTLNYQYKKHLFTARVGQLSSYKTRLLSPVLPFPLVRLEESIDEYALLYGRRYIAENRAFSFSAGVAFVSRKYFVVNEGNFFYVRKNAVGLPFEASVKWFKRRRVPYHIYGIIPIGKPTAFGNSFGFKVLGNVSKTTFVGIGVTFGFGYHKYY